MTAAISKQTTLSEPSRQKRITILGATGTIGKNTLDIIDQYPERFQLHAASGHSNIAAMCDIIQKYTPRYVTMSNENALHALKQSPEAAQTTIIDSTDPLLELASLPCEMMMHALVGAAGIQPLYTALKQGQTVAIANKESLVCAGHIIMPLVREQSNTFYPIDSEHSSLFQLYQSTQKDQITQLTLTASGGPFLHTPLNEMAKITPAQAVKHPNWVMGAKISIDSATMMNKGLELIEAHYLFDIAPEKLDAIIHPQSIIHGMVHLTDGSVMAHLSHPDMRIPIAYALHEGEYQQNKAKTLDFTELATLAFSPIDPARYPAFGLCKQALDDGPAAMIMLNAANEIAVQAFLEERISYLDITKIIEQALTHANNASLQTVEDILAFDKECRHHTQTIIKQGNT